MKLMPWIALLISLAGCTDPDEDELDEDLFDEETPVDTTAIEGRRLVPGANGDWCLESPYNCRFREPGISQRVLTAGGDDSWGVAPGARPAVVTTLYAMARATAQTAAAYQRMDQRGVDEWLEQARATRDQVTDLARRYPLSTELVPHSPQWQESPRAALTSAVAQLARAVAADAPLKARHRRGEARSDRKPR